MARSTMAARSFSSPQGELDMHRLRRALERVSFDQTLGGRLDESDGETLPTPCGALSRRSLTDSSKIILTVKARLSLSFLLPSIHSSVAFFLTVTPSDGLLFPASPLDWDSFTDPEYLFTAAPLEDPPPGQCRSLIHGVLGGRPLSWEVTVDLGHLWTPEGQETTVGGGSGGGGGGEPWEEIIHQLTARSVIRDFEKMAEKETDIEHGEVFL